MFFLNPLLKVILHLSIDFSFCITAYLSHLHKLLKIRENPKSLNIIMTPPPPPTPSSLGLYPSIEACQGRQVRAKFDCLYKLFFLCSKQIFSRQRTNTHFGKGCRLRKEMSNCCQRTTRRTTNKLWKYQQ